MKKNTLNAFEKIFLQSKRPYLWIFGVGFLLYLRTLSFGFTYFDDNVLVLENLFFLKDLSNFFRSFTLEVFHIMHSSAAYYRPMLTISYMFDAQISGESAFFYHFTSVVIHLMNSCLLYLFLQKLNLKKQISFIFALVFCVHPVLTQAVSWIPGRNDSLLALFAIPSFIFFIDFLKKPNFRDLFYHLVFFALALFTKESAAFIPAMLLFYCALMGSFKKFSKNLPVFLVFWFFIFLGWFLLRSIALQGNALRYTFLTSLSAIFQNSPATLLYLGKVLFPFNLSVLPILSDSTLVCGVISLVIIFLLIMFSKDKNWKIIFFGLVWFLAFLLPAFIRPDTTYVADFLEHRIYLPLIGIFLIFGEIDFVKKADFEKKITWLVYGTVFSVLVCVNLVHNKNFKDRLTFWKNAVLTSPSHPLAHKNLGAMYYLGDNLDLALDEFEKAAALNPTETMIHNNLGLVYYRKGDYQKAEEEYLKELSYYPNYDNAFMNLGLLYYQSNRKDEAAQAWLKTITINPDHKEALKALAVYYTEDKKDTQKANYYYQEAIKRGVEF